MTISLIAAMTKNHVIGKDNKMPWHLPEDLKRFKRLTIGHTLIMGRKTYESLPIKPLPDRRNVILSRSAEDIPGCEIARSKEEALALCKEEEEVFIAGGEEIYKLFFPKADKLYLTFIHKDYEGDRFFEIPSDIKWHVLDLHSNTHKGISYDFIELQRAD